MWDNIDMVRLDDMRLFAQLADSGSLTAAAQALRMSKQTVSRRLAELERGLGVELARRTTRTLTLTDVGRAYAARCAEVTRLADETNRALVSQHQAVSGTLRISADPTFGEAFLPHLVSSFLAAHREVNVEVLLTSRRVNLVDEGFDVAFRVGPPPDVAHLAAKRLGAARLWTVASPDYLREQGEPLTPGELSAHDCLALVPSLTHTGWPFLIDGALRLVAVPSRVRVNGLAMARYAALAGAGIAQLPEFAAAKDVARGHLRRVLSSFTPEVGGVHVVYPHTQLLAPKVHEFVVLASERFDQLSLLQSSS